MIRTSFLVILLLALTLQAVQGKPACDCSSPKVPPPCPQRQPCVPKQDVPASTKPCSVPEPSTTTSAPKSNCVTAAPCVNPPTKQPCIANPTTTTTTTTTTTRRPTTTTTTTLAPPNTTPAPKSDCRNGEIYPSNTNSCDQFLMCRNQVYVLMVCPPGLGFNYQTKSCDWSANVPTCSKL